MHPDFNIDNMPPGTPVRSHEEAKQWLQEMVDKAAASATERIFPVMEQGGITVDLPDGHGIAHLPWIPHTTEFKTAPPEGIVEWMRKKINPPQQVMIHYRRDRLPRKLKKLLRRQEPGRLFVRNHWVMGHIVPDPCPPFPDDEFVATFTITIEPNTLP